MTNETITRQEEEQSLLERFALNLIDSGLCKRDPCSEVAIQDADKMLGFLLELRESHPELVKKAQGAYKWAKNYHEREGRTYFSSGAKKDEEQADAISSVYKTALEVLDGKKTMENWRTETDVAKATSLGESDYMRCGSGAIVRVDYFE